MNARYEIFVYESLKVIIIYDDKVQVCLLRITDEGSVPDMNIWSI